MVGVGSYGKVRCAWHRLTGSKIAIKTYDKARLKDPAHWKRVYSGKLDMCSGLIDIFLVQRFPFLCCLLLCCFFLLK